MNWISILLLQFKFSLQIFLFVSLALKKIASFYNCIRSNRYKQILPRLEI